MLWLLSFFATNTELIYYLIIYYLSPLSDLNSV